MSENTEFENPRNYPAEAIAKLRALVTGRTVARPDPRRANFYEIDAEQETFFIHVSPATQRVMLVARWSRKRSELRLPTGEPEECADLSACR